MAYDASAYEARRRGLMDQYASTGAANAYSNFLSQQRGKRSFNEMNKSYEKAQPQIIQSFSRKGMYGPNVQSGAFKKALQDFAQERISQTAQAQQELDQSQNMFNLGQSQLQSQYQIGLKDLEAEKARQIEEDALQLMALRSGF